MTELGEHFAVPIVDKYALTIREAAAYFGIGEHRIRLLVDENKNANYLLWVGNRCLIKREMFEKILDELNVF